MERQARVTAAVIATVLCGGTALAGCSSTGNPSASVSNALSAAQSGASALASAANSLASSASSAIASAEAAASSAIGNVKGGLDAKGDISLGTPVKGSDGRTDVPLTVTNHGSQSYRYTVQVNFDNASGDLVDTVIVTVPDVAAGGTAQATARSNRSLEGTVTPVVGNALRY